MKVLTIIITVFIFNKTSFSQVFEDSIITIKQSISQTSKRANSNIWGTKSKSKNRFWGNSTYISSSLNFAKNKEFDVNIGRTNGKIFGDDNYEGIPVGYYTLPSVGIGYSITNTSSNVKQSIKVFYEYNFIPFIYLGSFTVRTEYFYNITDKQNYLRPSLGLSFVYLDVSYNYSFLLNGNKSDNLYQHGVIVRAKYFLHRKNWRKIR
jgi:hypothetical protein